MTTSISSVAVHVVGRYNEAGKTLVAAYRTGGQRMLEDAGARYARIQPVTAYLGERLEIDSGRVIAVLDRVAAASTSGIETVANRAAQVQSPVATTVIRTVSALNLPIAAFTAQVAEQVAAGAKQIEARVAAVAAPREVAAPVAAKPARKARAKSARRSA